MDLPSDATLRLLVSRYAAFKAEHGAVLAGSELVLPTSEYFPDEFKGDAEGVGAFMARLLSYAPVATGLPIALHFPMPDANDQASGGGCSSGACGPGGKASSLDTQAPRVRARDDDGYDVDVNVGDVGSPTLLATSLARSVGAIVLAEGGPSRLGDTDDPVLDCEIAAAACGLGVLLANGSYVYAKGCGGVRVHQATALSVTEHAVLLALFVRDHGVKTSRARGQLDTTPGEAFDQAIAWLDSNPDILTALGTRPETLAAGLFTVEPVKSLLGRWFGKKRNSADAMVPAAPKRVRSPEEERRLAESRRLVEEALGKA